jgi:hypothetical protein
MQAATHNASSSALVLERGAASHSSFSQLPKEHKLDFEITSYTGISNSPNNALT